MSQAGFNKFGDAHTCIWCKCCYCWLSEWPSRERLFIYTDTRTNHSLSLSLTRRRLHVFWLSLAISLFCVRPLAWAQSSSQRHFTPPILLILMLSPTHSLSARSVFWYIMHYIERMQRGASLSEYFHRWRWQMTVEGGDWPNECFLFCYDIPTAELHH